MTFGEIVREARTGARWSLRDLSRELTDAGMPISHVQLHDVEHGRRAPSLRLLNALRKVLLLDRRYLVEYVPARCGDDFGQSSSLTVLGPPQKQYRKLNRPSDGVGVPLMGGSVEQEQHAAPDGDRDGRQSRP